MPAEKSRRRPLKVGVQLPEVELWQRGATWHAWRQRPRHSATTRSGSAIISSSAGDRAPRGPWEAWTIMAALAAVTERVQIGPLVACTSFHSPTMIAKNAATLDEVSGGRLILGLGAGWNEAEYSAFGFPYDHRVSRFEEAFDDHSTSLAGRGSSRFTAVSTTVDDCLIVPAGPRRRAATDGRLGSRGCSNPHALRSELERLVRLVRQPPENLTPWMQKLDEACRRLAAAATVERTPRSTSD